MSLPSRPSRTAKANASDKIKNQMDQLLQLTTRNRKGHLDLDLDLDQEGINSTVAPAPAPATSKRRKRRAADDLSDTEDVMATATATQQATATTDVTNATNANASKTRSSSIKKQKSGYDENNKSNNDKTTDKPSPVAEPSSSKTTEAKRKPGRPKKQKADDNGDGDHTIDKPDLVESSSSNPAEPNKKPGRPKKLRTDDKTVDQGGSLAIGLKSPASEEEPKRRPGRPKKLRTHDETTDQARSPTTDFNVSAEQIRKPTGSVSGSDDERPSASSARDTKHRRQHRQQQEQAVDENNLQKDSSGSEYEVDSSTENEVDSSTENKLDEMSDDGGDDYKDTPKSARKRASRKDKSNGKTEDSADESKVRKRRPNRTPSELEQERETRKERAQQRAQRKQAQLDAKIAKIRAKEAKVLKKARRSYLSIPVSVQLAQTAQNIVFQEKRGKQGVLEERRRRKRVKEATSVEWQEDEPSFATSNLIYQVLRPEKRGFSYRWPIREELLHTVPVSAFADSAGEPDFFEKQGLGFVEELSGVPKREDDYSDTDMEDDGSGSDNGDPLPKVKEGMKQQNNADRGKHEGKQRIEQEVVRKDNKDNQGDESGEETATERRLRRKRVQAALRSRRLEGIVEREESVPRDRHQRHEDERFANARLEAVQNFFNGEMAHFAQMQYQKGISERIQDLDKFQKLTALPEDSRRGRQAAVSVPVRAPIGSGRAGFDQEDDLTRIQQRAVAFSAEDALRKTLDRMVYVVRQGSLLRMPDYMAKVDKGMKLKAHYERGWDTVMTSAAMAGIDDRILKKVSMRMKDLL
ncbi:hypothetical protein BGX24_001004, partial [Mortierella sp. AD032]